MKAYSWQLAQRVASRKVGQYALLALLFLLGLTNFPGKASISFLAKAEERYSCGMERNCAKSFRLPLSKQLKDRLDKSTRIQ